jgi:DNA-directed RNA polymerase specialized sigma24 family protein
MSAPGIPARARAVVAVGAGLVIGQGRASMHESPQPAPATPDAFPSTRHTWIGEKLRQGRSGRDEVTQHIMALYAHPLAVFMAGSSFSSVGDPYEVVQDFFGDRLTKEGFLHNWLLSKRQLRHWLIVAFRHYLFERIRERQRARDRSDQSATLESFTVAPAVEHDYHRQIALAVVREALRMAEHSCSDAGCFEHWHVFVQHQYHDRSYSDLSRETGHDPSRLAVMSRTATHHLRNAVRRLVAWEGANDEEIDDEIKRLMETLSK